jgi:hypothetical protein
MLNDFLQLKVITISYLPVKALHSRKITSWLVIKVRISG